MKGRVVIEGLLMITEVYAQLMRSLANVYRPQTLWKRVACDAPVGELCRCVDSAALQPSACGCVWRSTKCLCVYIYQQSARV